MDDYENFLNTLQKRGSKPHHISHCFGSRDAWKWLRKNKWKALGEKPCDQSLYSNIVSYINQILAEKLLEGHEIVFPYQMGSLRVSSKQTKVSIENGVIKTNYPTDWKRTLQYWYEDEGAKKAHKTIKWMQKRLVFVRYYKKSATYKNRRFYSFRPNRSLVKTLSMNCARGMIKAEPVEC